MAESTVDSGFTIFDLDGHELAAKLTCLTLLLVPVGDWYIRAFVLCLSAAGLLVPGFWRSRWLWTGLTLLTALRFWLDWPLADNHAYLLSYWCLALALTDWLGERRVLVLNARWLLGLTFLLATVQKWTAPDYPSGVFFLTTFLLDERFEDLVVLLTPVTYEQIDLARDYLEGDYRAGVTAGLPFELPFSLILLARASAVWNLFDQALVAAAFLVPPAWSLGQARDAVLLVFCLVTYAIAPVASFGWLLLAMGTAQSDASRRVRLGYLVTFAVLVFYYEVPWAGLLVDFLGAA